MFGDLSLEPQHGFGFYRRLLDAGEIQYAGDMRDIFLTYLNIFFCVQQVVVPVGQAQTTDR